MSTTTNLDTLTINYLTQAQYEAEVSAGTIDEDALYLTPDTAATTQVIQTGVSSGWTYRVWSDGTMEMWGTASDSTAASTSDGGGYRTSGVTPSNFPLTFADVPIVNVSLRCGSLVMAPICLSNPTVSSAGKWAGYRVSTNSNTTAKTFMFYVIGTKAS